MTVTATRPSPPIVTVTDSLPTVEETIAAVRAVRAGRVEPQEAHPTTSPWTPVVHWTAALTGAASIAAVAAYWQVGDTAGAWALIVAFTLAVVTLRARAEEWNTNPVRNNP